MRGKNDQLAGLKPTFPVMIGADENITLVLNTKWHGTSSRWQYIGIQPDHGNITQYTRCIHAGCAFSPAQLIKSYTFITANLFIIYVSLQLVCTIYFYYQHTTCLSPVSSQLVFH